MNKRKFRHDIIARMKKQPRAIDVGDSDLISSDFEDYLTSRIWRISENPRNYFINIAERLYTLTVGKKKYKKNYLKEKEKAFSLFYPTIQKN